MSPVTVTKNSAAVKGKSSRSPIPLPCLILTCSDIYSFPRRRLRYHVNAVIHQQPVSVFHDVSMRPVKQSTSSRDHHRLPPSWSAFDFFSFWYFRCVLMGCGRRCWFPTISTHLETLSTLFNPNYILRYHDLALFPPRQSASIDQRNGLSQWIWMDSILGWKEGEQ